MKPFDIMFISCCVTLLALVISAFSKLFHGKFVQFFVLVILCGVVVFGFYALAEKLGVESDILSTNTIGVLFGENDVTEKGDLSPIGTTGESSRDYGNANIPVSITAAPTAVPTRAPRKDNLIYLTPYFQGSINSFNTPETDINGNTYSTGLYGYMDRGDDDFQCYWKWRIDGEYTLLTATIFVRAADIGAKHVGAVLIYGDDMLLFELDNIDSTTRAVPISVDISGVYDLKVEIFGDGNMYNYGIMPHLGDIYLS